MAQFLFAMKESLWLYRSTRWTSWFRDAGEFKSKVHKVRLRQLVLGGYGSTFGRSFRAWDCCSCRRSSRSRAVAEVRLVRKGKWDFFSARSLTLWRLRPVFFSLIFFCILSVKHRCLRLKMHSPRPWCRLPALDQDTRQRKQAALNRWTAHLNIGPDKAV